MLQLKIIAIPYAAGTAYSFQAVFIDLKPLVQAEAFEYPGHGRKIFLPLLESVPEIAQAILAEMFPIYEPYCLLGYSMGGHVLCELYRLLLKKRYPLPAHVFLCAIDVPKQEPEEATDTSDQALQKELMELGGTASEILENQEFMEMLLPIYRADIVAERNYVLPYDQIFRCEGTVIVGEAELNEENHFSEWQRYFAKPVRFRKVKGGHFFIQEEPGILAKILLDTIAGLQNEAFQIKNQGGNHFNED